MKQVTTRQHYLPRYRLQYFLRRNNKYYVYSNGTNPNRRDRETGKNDSSFALCDKLYELTEVPSWAKHENLIETVLLANDVEPEDAGEIKKAINSIKANTKLSLSDSEWLGKYALRMLYRSPAYMKKIKSLPQFNDPMAYYAFIPVKPGRSQTRHSRQGGTAARQLVSMPQSQTKPTARAAHVLGRTNRAARIEVDQRSSAFPDSLAQSALWIRRIARGCKDDVRG